MYLADNCSCWSFVGTMTKFLWRRKCSLTTSGSLKMDLCLVLTECLSRRILRFRTPAIDLIHSERVSTLTSFFAHLFWNLNTCFENEGVSDNTSGSFFFKFWFVCKRHYVSILTEELGLNKAEVTWVCSVTMKSCPKRFRFRHDVADILLKVMCR